MTRVGGDLLAIETGPCALLVGGLAVGHTQDGIKFNVQPDIRVRTVDEHGSAKADVIYQGETIEISATLAEKTAANLRRVYAWGYEVSSTRHAWGRNPGLRGSEFAAQIIIRPLDADGSSDDVVFYLCALQSCGEVNLGDVKADRVFSAVWSVIVSPDNGYRIGEIRAGAAVSGDALLLASGSLLLGGGGRLLLGG